MARQEGKKLVHVLMPKKDVTPSPLHLSSSPQVLTDADTVAVSQRPHKTLGRRGREKAHRKQATLYHSGTVAERV